MESRQRELAVPTRVRVVPVKRFAWLALAIVVGFLGSSLDDRCEDASSDGCPPVCHVSCLDGCGVAPVAVESPAVAAVAAAVVELEAFELAPLDLDFPPDLSPPRA